MFMKWIICILFDSDCSLIRIIYVHIIRASRPLECTDLYNSYFLKNRDFAWISTVACAWHRQVKAQSKFAKYTLHQPSKISNWQLGVSLSLTSAAVKFKARMSPRLKSSRFALGRRRQAHAFNLPKTTNLKELNHRKDSNKTRGGGQGVLR